MSMSEAPGQSSFGGKFARRRLARITRLVGWFELRAQRDARADGKRGVRQPDRDVSPIVEAYDKLGGVRWSALLNERTRIGARTNVARRKGRFAVKAREKNAEREREDDGSASVGPGQPRNECKCEAAGERNEREQIG